VSDTGGPVGVPSPISVDDSGERGTVPDGASSFILCTVSVQTARRCQRLLRVNYGSVRGPKLVPEM
jgi:hypothetical protein